MTLPRPSSYHTGVVALYLLTTTTAHLTCSRSAANKRDLACCPLVRPYPTHPAGQGWLLPCRLVYLDDDRVGLLFIGPQYCACAV